MTNTVQLGKAFQKQPPDYGPLAEVVAGLRESVAAEVRDAIVREVAVAVTEALAGGITVAAPQVSVAAPSVSVTPTIQVDVPGEDDAGEIEAIDRQTTVLLAISSKLDRLLVIASQPVNRKVIRDSQGQIIEVDEVRQ